MKFIASILMFLLICSCNEQSVYELNKAELEHCHTCRPKDKNPNPNPEWVQTDIARYREMVNPIANLKPTITDYLTVYPSLLSGKGNALSKTIGLLDELKLTTHDFFGGYTSFNLKILTYNDLVIYSRL